MAVADNLAAHALRGFCNFSIVDKFRRLCNCTKDQLIERVEIDHKFILKTQKGYNNNIANIESDPELCSLYGMKSIRV